MILFALLSTGVFVLIKKTVSHSDALHRKNCFVFSFHSCHTPAAQAGRRRRDPRYERVLCPVAVHFFPFRRSGGQSLEKRFPISFFPNLSVYRLIFSVHDVLSP